MAEFEDQLRRASALLRDERSPPSGARARVLDSLGHKLGGGEGLDGEHGSRDVPGAGEPPDVLGDVPGAGSGARLMFGAKVAAAIVGSSAAGLAALRLGVLAVYALAGIPGSSVGASGPTDADTNTEVVIASENGDVEPSPSASSLDTRSLGEGSSKGGSDGGLGAPSPSDSGPSLDPESGAGGARSKGSSGASEADREAPKTGAVADIRAELALINEAREASDPAKVRAALRRHAEAFPDGSLAAEREALWAITSCKVGALKDAETHARALVSARPNSPLVERVARACPTLASEL